MKNKDMSLLKMNSLTESIYKNIHNKYTLNEYYDLPIDHLGEFAGWIAQYQGKKIEINKSEADGIYGAKQLAIKKLKVPKSKEGLLSIQPGYNYNESLNEDTQYDKKIFLDDLPQNIELEDGYRFKYQYDVSKKKPYKQITIPFVSIEEAEEYCKDNNISTDNIQNNGGDIYIKYTQHYQVIRVNYIIDCILNQYEGHTVNNTFKNFPLHIKDLAVKTITNKDIISAIKSKYNSVSLPTNIGVQKNSVKGKAYEFEIKLLKNFEESLSAKKVVGKTWGEFIANVENETEYAVDAAYRNRPEDWIILIDDEGNMYDAEVTKYYKGGYELMLYNVTPQR